MSALGDVDRVRQRKRRPLDAMVAELARRQHGVVARRQLVALGLSREQIDWRLRTGRLHQLHRGVYAVGHRRITGQGRVMAAVLAYGPSALASHRTAAGEWGLLPDNRPTVDVTVAGRSGRRRGGIVLHRPRCLHPEDRAACEGIPVTSVARTILDVAGGGDERRVERMFEAAERLRLFDRRALERVCERNPRHRGRHPVLRLLAEACDPQFTRSDVERDFLRLCRDAGIPEPATNVIVEGYEVDCLWRDERLIVELDTRTFHATRRAFEDDRLRDATLQVAGFRVLRVTGRRLYREPRAVGETVRALRAA